MSKYKYYFRKPRSEITKDILLTLVATGVVVVAATSPYFGVNLARGLLHRKQYKEKRVYDTFYQLRKAGCLELERKGHQVFIRLTPKGRKRAGRLQIDSLKIKKPSRWDGKFRFVVFDIAQLKLIYRNAFRSKLQELGFIHFQKSVWVHPYPCKDEIDTLRDFFGLNPKEVCLLVAEETENKQYLRERFGLA
ncbi:MAG: hypothetical protein HYW97_01405 [Candidatus Wildermuthbacteria bacterium]|nr:hypothetical protein [Candidatus Wildermuthbacteria bacterium]